MNDQETCKFEEAWIGKCKHEVKKDGVCNWHYGIKCVNCGNQATHTCEETAMLVCGAPLCDDCEHTICENGCNSGAPLPKGLKHHCRKSEQVYQPWYMRKP